MLGCKLTLEELQSETLMLLTEFSEFCEMHGLRYYLACGALLGAIRHGGAIPWDDDVDVLMPRPDYDRLLSLGFATERCFASRPNSDDDVFGFLKIYSRRTRFFQEGIYNPRDYAVFLDVFPVDGLPSRNPEKYWKCVRAKRKVFSCAYACNYRSEKNRNIRGALKWLVGLFGRLKPKDAWMHEMEQLAKASSFEDSKYVSVYCGTLPYERERMERADFENPSCVEYEGHMFKTFRDPEKYLLRVYGQNWRTPIKQAAHIHGCAVWREGFPRT